MVAVGGVISAPDEVTVIVGDASPGSGPTPVPPLDPRPSGPTPLAATPAPALLPTAEQVLGLALPRLSEGRQVAGQVADVFESVAGRVDLYTSFAELQDELRRRLDVVIPVEALQRQAWVQTVFQPLTLTTASQLAASGVDLQSPASLGQALTPEQRQGVRSHFMMLARAFRAARRPSGPNVSRGEMGDDERMRTHSHHRIAAIVLALGLCLVQGTPRVLGSGAPGSDYRAALEIARTRGVPMVVIVTARDVSVSLRLWDEFQDGPWARTHRGLVLVVQVCRESEPQLVRTWNITRFPTAIVFSPDANGMTALGSTSDCAGGAAAGRMARRARLRREGTGRARSERPPRPRSGPMLTRLSNSRRLHQPRPPRRPLTARPRAPAYAAPLATTSAGIIQVPSQNYVIQQAPRRSSWRRPRPHRLCSAGHDRGNDAGRAGSSGKRLLAGRPGTGCSHGGGHACSSGVLHGARDARSSGRRDARGHHESNLGAASVADRHPRPRSWTGAVRRLALTVR